ncbi:MAG: DUF5011 domain-containing protein, partial [Actinobacteria bacterium]
MAASPPPTTGFASGEFNSWIPPDTDGAVGPNHLVTAINGSWIVQNRSGTVLFSQDLGDFWSGWWNTSNPSCSEEPFDPRIVYDDQVGQWITVAIRGRSTCLDRSAILVAVSTTSDPTGTWTRFTLDSDSTNTVWADYPNLGFNGEYVIVTANMFSAASAYQFPKVWALERPVTGSSLKWHWHGLDPFDFGFTMVPAITHDAGVTTGYLASSWNASLGAIALYEIDSPVPPATAPTISGGATAYPVTTPWSFSSPSANFAPQLGSGTGINNGDARMQGLVMRNGELWAAHHVFLPASGPTRTAIQWWNLATSGTVLQQGRIDDPTGTVFSAFPSIAVNASDDVLIGYSTFSSTQYPSAAYSLRLGTDPVGTFNDTALLKAGEGPYVMLDTGGRNRWGDYSSTHVDPLDDDAFWTIQEYSKLPVGPDGRWGTWWGQVEPTASGLLADLSLTLSDAPDPATSGGSFDVTAGVANAGPDPASNVVLSLTLPAGIAFDSGSITDGAGSQTCTEASGVVTCSVASIASGDGETATITVDVGAPTVGPVITSGQVLSDESDPAGPNNSDSETTTVVDATAPLITLLGTNPMTVAHGSVFADPGATASDNVDGDLSGSIVVGGDVVNTVVVGSYDITYNVSDAAGNDAVQLTRTVNVTDQTAPVITLLGDDPMTVPRNGAFVDPGATASDNVDGDVSAAIVVGGDTVNTAVLGTYEITYDVSDTAGNPATQVTRTVNVTDQTAPVITLLGPNPMTVPLGGAFADPGKTAL